MEATPKEVFLSGNIRKKAKKMEPAVGFEPTTDGLQNRSSTTELSWLGYLLMYTIFQNCQAGKYKKQRKSLQKKNFSFKKVKNTQFFAVFRQNTPFYRIFLCVTYLLCLT